MFDEYWKSSLSEWTDIKRVCLSFISIPRSHRLIVLVLPEIVSLRRVRRIKRRLDVVDFGIEILVGLIMIIAGTPFCGKQAGGRMTTTIL